MSSVGTLTEQMIELMQNRRREWTTADISTGSIHERNDRDLIFGQREQIDLLPVCVQ